MGPPWFTCAALIAAAYPCPDEASLLSPSALPCYQSPVINLRGADPLRIVDLYIKARSSPPIYIAAARKLTLHLKTCDYLYSTDATVSLLMSPRIPWQCKKNTQSTSKYRVRRMRSQEPAVCWEREGEMRFV